MRINIRVRPADDTNNKDNNADNAANYSRNSRGISGGSLRKAQQNFGQSFRQRQAKQKLYLTPETLLKYFITDDDAAHTLITCKNTEYNLMTSDANLYQAIGSIKEYDNFKLNRLVKLLEVVDVFSTRQAGREKFVLKESRIEELRKLALKKTE